MEKKLLILSLSLLTMPWVIAQPGYGKVMEGLKASSKILNKEVQYTIYLPADYDHSSRTYPVVYLLHGYTDDDSGWL